MVLLAGLFLTFLIAGQDKGQLRDGLESAAIAIVEPAVTQTDVVAEVVFVPAQPVARPQVVADGRPKVVPLAAAKTVTPTVVPAAVPAPPLVLNQQRQIIARSANMRSGPSTRDPVLLSLQTGATVQVITDAAAETGWTRVRIAAGSAGGTDIEGYIASRLLSEPVRGEN